MKSRFFHLLPEQQTKEVFIFKIRKLFNNCPKALPKHLGFPEDKDWESWIKKY
jgi:hypothetical protein